MGIYQQITTLLRRCFTTHLPCECTGDEDLDNRLKSEKTKHKKKNIKNLKNSFMRIMFRFRLIVMSSLYDNAIRE